MNSKNMSPIQLYKDLTITAFIENLQGPNVEALRRALKGWYSSPQIYRMTPEFERLIEF